MYGALAGHLQQVLPVCHTRADVLWAYIRCWLESQVDRHLAESLGKGGLVNGLRVGKDAVACTQQGRPEEVHRVVLDDVADFWPPSRYRLTSWHCACTQSACRTGLESSSGSLPCSMFGKVCMPCSECCYACAAGLFAVMPCMRRRLKPARSKPNPCSCLRLLSCAMLCGSSVHRMLSGLRLL